MFGHFQSLGYPLAPSQPIFRVHRIDNAVHEWTSHVVCTDVAPAILSLAIVSLFVQECLSFSKVGNIEENEGQIHLEESEKALTLCLAKQVHL